MNPQTPVDVPQNASPEPEQGGCMTLEETVSSSYVFFWVLLLNCGYFKFQAIENEVFDQDHLDLSIAQRRRQRNIPLPKQFEDPLPENLQALPPVNPGEHLPSSSLNIFESPRNSYGLFRRYFSNSFPSHDPDSDLSTEDRCDVPPAVTSADLPDVPLQDENQNYGPYPNRSSFVLGEWNWNGEVQKSKSSFKALVDIIVDPDFHPDDIRETQWEAIDTVLGSSESPEIDSSEELPSWVKNDARWTKTPITISVPFHRYTISPGPRDYVVPEFYHRSIISILQEALSHSLDGLHFHYEPYELYWKRNIDTGPIRVFGELYASPAFIDAHRALQAKTKEPGCELPRFVAGLMLASDATHLTSFGNAKVWPQYLYFGNHSKYRRCKPNCHLYYHVAYFQKVLVHQNF